MSDPIIDRDAIIEKAKIHIYNEVEDADWGNAYDAAAAALPSIADDLLAPIDAALDEWHEGNATAVLVHVEQAIAAIRKAVRA